ncbi:MAG: class E sortase [Ilumatobacteraceae bacterium]
MSPVTPCTSPTGSRPVRRAVAALAIAALALVTSCGGQDAAAPPTSASTTTSSTTSSTTTSTTSTTSTTLPELPVLEPAPPPGEDEPVVELGTMEIPAIDVSETLYEGVALSTLDLGPGHWPGSAMPGGYGNAVVGGHRTSHSRPFYYLDRLVPGDEIIYTTAEGRFVYVITETRIVSPEDMWVVEQTPGYTTTLFACHPLHSTAQRIIIRATLQTA